MAAPDTFTVSPLALARLGLPSVERLCERAGVAPSGALRTNEFFRLWRAAEEDIGDRGAGLRFGAEGIDRGYAVASIVALHAPDFRSALVALGRYKRLTCPELVEVEIEGDEAKVRYRWLQATGQVPRLLVDTTMAALLELARRGTAGRVAPVRVELARRPMDRALLSRHFGCPSSSPRRTTPWCSRGARSTCRSSPRTAAPSPGSLKVSRRGSAPDRDSPRSWARCA